MNDVPQPGPPAPEGEPPPQGTPPSGWPQAPSGYAQQPWPQAPPGWGRPMPFPPAPPAHPDSNTALIWGIVAVFGGLSFCLPLLASPFAWFYGARVVREIHESQRTAHPLGGLSEAKAGKVMGLVGTCLLGIGILGLCGFIALAVFAES